MPKWFAVPAVLALMLGQAFAAQTAAPKKSKKAKAAPSTAWQKHLVPTRSWTGDSPDNGSGQSTSSAFYRAGGSAAPGRRSASGASGGSAPAMRPLGAAGNAAPAAAGGTFSAGAAGSGQTFLRGGSLGGSGGGSASGGAGAPDGGPIYGNH